MPAEFLMGEMTGTFKKNPPCAQWVLGGQIDSEITMNSQCTPWVNTPLPPVSAAMIEEGLMDDEDQPQQHGNDEAMEERKYLKRGEMEAVVGPWKRLAGGRLSVWPKRLTGEEEIYESDSNIERATISKAYVFEENTSTYEGAKMLLRNAELKSVRMPHKPPDDIKVIGTCAITGEVGDDRREDRSEKDDRYDSDTPLSRAAAGPSSTGFRLRDAHKINYNRDQ